VKVYVERDGQERALKMAKNMIASHFNCSKGEKAILEIFEDRLTRSQKQNKLYWLWLKVIEDETGQPKDDYLEAGKWHKGLHTRFKCDFIDKEFYKDGSQKIPSTKKLKVKEFSDYLERLDIYSAELGIKLPQPIDLYYQSMGIVE